MPATHDTCVWNGLFWLAHYTTAALVRPGGLLAVMTGFQPKGAGDFSNWHYRRDPTHVVFYAEKTFALLAEERGWTCEVPFEDVVFMRKPP